MTPTSRRSGISHRTRGFVSLVDALEYAAEGDTGCNFYDGSGNLETAITYATLKAEAIALAQRLVGLGVKRGARVGIVAETDPMFPRFFFACQYAGLIPVALPAGLQMGGGEAFVEQLHRMLDTCGADIAVAPESHLGFLERASRGLNLIKIGTPDEFAALAPSDSELEPLGQDETAYLQYTSGSTRFPRGVEMTQTAVLANLTEIAEVGCKITEDDRLVSWLPFYHDMGLVGCVLIPVATQISVDFLSPRTFAMRPRLWLKILSENRGTISSSPPFGYELCATRVRMTDTAKYDLSAWRVACVGAERINPRPLRQFARVLEPAGFNPDAFLPCYGMAEVGLAISFAALTTTYSVDVVAKAAMAERGKALIASDRDEHDNNTLSFVDCGEALPSYDLSIRDESDTELPERECGRIWVRGPSQMKGYFRDPQATAEVIKEGGWLDTGDIGYRIGRRLFLTSRAKDVIIVNGRNIWPQDLEQLAEKLPEIRLGAISAFSVTRPNQEELAVMVVESRNSGPDLTGELAGLVRENFGINCFIDLAPPRTLPRTSSGKLSRTRAKADFLARTSWSQDGFPETDIPAQALASG
jgi:fatty-acyl-CoA synthase